MFLAFFGADHFANEHTYGNVNSAVDARSSTIDGTIPEIGMGKRILTEATQNGLYVGFAYDTELQLKSVTNEGGEVYHFGLDALGNLVSEWGFNGMNRRYLRDSNSRVNKVLRPAEKWTAYEYDGI